MHLVSDAIALDAKLVPLYRLMAAACDAAVGIGGAAAPLPGVVSGGAVGRSGGDIADAERVLAQHFGGSGAPAVRAAAPVPRMGSDIDEAERVLAQHFK